MPAPRRGTRIQGDPKTGFLITLGNVSGQLPPARLDESGRWTFR
jgi:hypothetical protein